MIRLLILAAWAISAPVQAQVEPEFPDMILVDPEGNEVSRHILEREAMQSASEHGNGVYTVIRPDGTITVRGLVEVIPEPEPDPCENSSAVDCEPEPDPAPEPEPEPVPPSDIPLAACNNPTGNPILYSRVPRTLSNEFRVNGNVVPTEHLDVWDRLPEVGAQFSGFNAPGQLVRCNPDGTQEMVFDGFADPDAPIVPFDVAPSPDGTAAMFAAYQGTTLKYPGLRANEKLPNARLAGKITARVWGYDLEDRTLVGVTPGGDEIATSPIYLPDGCIMFASNRHGEGAPFIPPGIAQGRVPSHLYRDCGTPVDITPDALGGALHPWLLGNGRVGYSSKWLSHNLPFRYNNSQINRPDTLENMWVLQDMDYTGGDMTALLGSHKGGFVDSGGRRRNMKALHFIGQRMNGDICIANYYRGNNLGLGEAWCFSPEPKLLEGPAPQFLPRKLYVVAEWAMSNDEACWNSDCAKAGFPDGTSDGQVMLTVCRGWCTTVAYSRTVTPGRIGSRGWGFGADTGIYKTSRIPSKSVDDLVRIVDDPNWHEFNAREVYPRQIAVPPVDRTDDGSCVMTSSDAGSTDAHHYGRYKFNDMFRAMANNGGEIHGLDHSELAAVRFYQVEPNGTARESNITGNALQFLGDVPLLPDDSFSALVPCETPLLMAGVDVQGRIIKRDQIPMSLRAGEQRVCTGCHLHGSEGRPYAESLAFPSQPVRLPLATPVPTWQQDIAPIVQEHCASCHAGDVITNYAQLTYDPDQNHAINVSVVSPQEKFWKFQKGLQRPATSKYINSMFARESLFAWVFRGSRQDGRTNDQYDDDIDYPADHPVIEVPEDQVRTVEQWIDGGYPK